MKSLSWRHYTEPWYYGYAFQAVVVFGTGAILMPIIVNNAGDAAKAGTVVGCFYIGQMFSPLIGTITDRTGWHRAFYLSGYALLAIGLALFPFTQLVWFWMALAFIQGVGSGTSNTVAAMFIVEYKPKSEWDGRVGWLQTFYGVGQAAGLGLAAVLQARPELGLLVSAGLMVPGLVLGARGLPQPHLQQKQGRPGFARSLHRPPRSISSILNHYEGSFSRNLRRLLQEWHSRFGVYILGWFLVMVATWLIGTLYPLLMKSAFNLSYSLSALYYALGAVIGIFAYSPSGTLGKKVGDGWVVIIGTIMTLASISALTILAYVKSDLNQVLVPVTYILIPIAWSPLIVGGTAWTAQLATFEEGEAIGSFNGANAIAAIIAAFTAGIVAHKFGYSMILLIASVASLLALLCFFPLVKRAKSG